VILDLISEFVGDLLQPLFEARLGSGTDEAESDIGAEDETEAQDDVAP
jgi:hypothetical protein